VNRQVNEPTAYFSASFLQDDAFCRETGRTAKIPERCQEYVVIGLWRVPLSAESDEGFIRKPRGLFHSSKAEEAWLHAPHERWNG